MAHEQSKGRQGGPRRLLRTALIILCVIVTLAALGIGGAVTAQRFSSAAQANVVAPITYVSQQPPDAQANGGSQATPTPTPAGTCKCSSSKVTISVPQWAYLPPPPTGSFPLPSGGAPKISGQVVLVSLAQQWLWAYQDGHLILESPVTTGMPGLTTPTGTFNIQMKEASVMFYSPWPIGSPYYYTPEFIPYAMLFRGGGFYLHTALWRHQFGPGTEYPHTDADGTQETGSHGCVNMPYTASKYLYMWIHVGTTVIIRSGS